MSPLSSPLIVATPLDLPSLGSSPLSKGLMILQYAPLLLLPLLPSDAATKGLPVKRMGGQRVRLSLQRLSSVIADGRILFRLFGEAFLFLSENHSDLDLTILCAVRSRSRPHPAVVPLPARKASGWPEGGQAARPVV